MTDTMGNNKPFNVGDKVVNLRYLHLWKDSFFHVQFLNDAVQVVLLANEKHFTFNPLIKLPLSIVPESYVAQHIFTQESGVCVVDKSKSVLSIERQSDTIRDILNNAFAEAIKSTKDEFSSAPVGAGLVAIDTHNKQKFARITFLHERFEEVVKVIFAK